MGRPKLPPRLSVLATLERLHAVATNAATANAYRYKARQLASRLEIATPLWAAPRSHSHGRGAAPSALGRVAREKPLPLTIASSLAVPAELRAWCARTRGGIVHVNKRETALYTMAAIHRFQTVDAAIAWANGDGDALVAGS